jgi:hypothetical protein
VQRVQPQLVLTCCGAAAAGQKPVLKSKQGAFQIVNSVEMFKPLSKFTKQARAPGGPVQGCL